jgi:hypothetical protein
MPNWWLFAITIKFPGQIFRSIRLSNAAADSSEMDIRQNCSHFYHHSEGIPPEAPYCRSIILIMLLLHAIMKNRAENPGFDKQTNKSG